MCAELHSLNSRRRVLLTLYVFVVLGYLSTILSLLFYTAASIVLVNATTLFYLFVVRLLDKGYNRAYAQLNLEHCCQRLEDLRILGRRDKDPCPNYAALFPMADSGRMMRELGAAGTWRGRSIQVAEVVGYYPLRRPSVKRKIGVANGLFLECAVRNEAGLELFAASRGAFDSDPFPEFLKEQGFCLLETPTLPQLALYGKPANDMAAARPFIQKASSILDKTPNGGLICLRDNALSVFLAGRSLQHKIPLLQDVSVEAVRWNSIPELDTLLELEL